MTGPGKDKPGQKPVDQPDFSSVPDEDHDLFSQDVPDEELPGLVEKLKKMTEGGRKDPGEEILRRMIEGKGKGKGPDGTVNKR